MTKALGINSLELFSLSIKYLTLSIEGKDIYTLGHSERVKEYSVAIAKRMGISGETLSNIYFGGLLHDIGKVRVPEEILKKRAKLNYEERTIMQQHVIYAQYIIGYYHFLSHINSMIKHHHERWNGSGYPDGLSGTSIPLGARIIGVADTFDAMTTNRIYKTQRTLRNALNFIIKKSGILFDHQVVEAFVGLFNEGIIHYIRGFNYFKVKEEHAWEQSLKNLRKSEILSNDPNFRFNAGLKTLELLLKMRKMPSAYHKIKELEELSSKYELPLPASFLNEKALYYFYRKSFHDSEKLSEMVLSSPNEEKLLIARAHRHLGMCYWKENLNDAAVLEISYSENIYLDLIKDFYMKTEYEESNNIEYYQKVLEKHQDIEVIMKNLAKIYDIQGRIQYTLGNFKKSLEYYNRSLEKKNEIGDDYGLSISYGGRGKLLSLCGKYSLAMTDFLTNMRITKRLGLTYSTYMAMIEYTKNFIRENEFKLAQKILKEVKRDYALDHEYFLAQSYFLYKKRHYNKALEKFENINIRKIRKNEDRLFYYFLLGKIHFGKVQLKEAVKNMEIAAMYAQEYRYLFYENLYLKLLEKYYLLNGDRNKATRAKEHYRRIETSVIKIN
ncbi:HD domain-containing protein [bacterium]|nr:HD domain-containing protein [bacterium]